MSPTTPFAAFIGRSPVMILLDPTSENSCISPVLVHRLDLPCSFGISGVQLATANLNVPTDDGGYDSHLSFTVSYGLTSNIILGNDWFTACKPILADDRSRFLRPTPSTVENLQCPHSWHPTKSLSYLLDLTLNLPLTSHPASIRLARSLHNDVEAREVLAFLVKGCYSNALFCSEMAADHRYPASFLACCQSPSILPFRTSFAQLRSIKPRFISLTSPSTVLVQSTCPRRTWPNHQEALHQTNSRTT